MPQEIEKSGPHTKRPLSDVDREAPFEEIYSRHAKVGVIPTKVYTLEQVTLQGMRVHRNHPKPYESWLYCDHPECGLWQQKFDSTPSPGDV